MTDPISVAAAYTIVLGGLALYISSILRRTRAAGRLAATLESQRARGGQATDRGAVGPGPGPVEPR